MAISTRFDDSPGYLLVTNTGGNDTLQDSIEYVDRVFAECKRLGRVALLIDDRQAAHRVATADALAVAEHLQNALGAKHVERMAVVPGPESLIATDDFAVFMRARGMGFKVFQDIEAARAWISIGGRKA
jgi:hypothetical protein